MRTVFFFIIALVALSCTSKNTTPPAATSYWTHLKDSFPQKNLTSFVIESQDEVKYKKYPPIRNKVIDSIVGAGTSYLYSWQEDIPGLTGFTTFADYGEHGSQINYFIFDSKDSLLSFTEVAHKAGEGGVIYEMQSKFISKDTMLKISAATTEWDLTKPAPPPKLSKPKGDSAFFHLIFQKDGKVVEKQFAEKKELNLQ